MTQRAVVAQTRVPEVDRDSGSQQVNLYVEWLRDRGWSVAFVATNTDGDPHHAHRLRQLGVPTYVGHDEAKELLSSQRIDLAVLAFWKPASQLLPLIRATSPEAHVIVDSVDLHFLREARRALGSGTRLDDAYGSRLARELNTYRDADAVITPARYEVELLANFLEGARVHDLPLAKAVRRSERPFEDRRGMFFAGNFRHLPNGEAVEYLCREILPLLEPDLLEENPLTVVGSRLDDKVRAHGRGLSAVQMVGWVPSIEPYLERARICVAPLLHGAGVKGKIVEAMLRGTPVVTTPIGAEGMGLRSGEHAMVAERPADLAAAITELLSSPQRWQRLSDAGYELASARHAPDVVGARFHEIVEDVLAAERQVTGVTRWRRRTGRRELAYRAMVGAVKETLTRATEAGSTVLVVSRGDDALTSAEDRRVTHFPRDSDGKWTGNHPSDSDEAIRRLEAEREQGARYLALPASSFWWLHHYDGLAEHLESRYRRIHASEHLVLFELGAPPRAETPGATPDEQRVLVVGACEDSRGEPYEAIVAELDRSRRCTVTHAWTPAAGDGDPSGMPPLPSMADPKFDWTLFISDRVTLPRHFLDDLLRLASVLAHSGVERLQPVHAGPPEAGPPVMERLRGVLGREVEAMAPIPVLAVRGGSPTSGPVVLADVCPIELREPIADPDPSAYSNVLDVFSARFGARRAVERSQRSGQPLISVLIATHARPELLRLCLAGFCDQTLPVAEFELVVVDDGSPDDETEAELREFAGRLPLSWTRIEHSGRSAAKNLAVMLARGEIVIFFDDDDTPAPDLLAQHLRAHELNAEETTAVLGHTEWAPGLEVSPLMHYLTDVDKMLFSYGNLKPGERRNWQAFWEGRVSAKRSLLLRHGLHDQRLDYSIDVELAWRLSQHGLEVIYEPAARSFMARSVDFDAFCRRCEDKGRAGAAIAALHPEEEIARYLKLEGAEERWRAAQPGLEALVARVHKLEAELPASGGSGGQRDGRLKELHLAYRAAFQAHTAKGLAEGADVTPGAGRPAASAGNGRSTLVSVPAAAATSVSDEGGDDAGDPPALTVTMPVWNRSEETAEMVARVIDRVWEVSRMPTEVVVVDNGSPVQRELRARVHRFERNHGVASGWNAGIALARAPVIAVLNSDCLVEEGWDEALFEAATTGRRIAFPYTDHCDGRGFRRADQAGTAGWCFMLSRATFEEIGPFDERFNPAYGEDNDYWHRAWKLGVELTPVPDAHVIHPRRMSADARADALLVGHRYLYGWKHGVEPMRPPPYFDRKVVEYSPSGRVPYAATSSGRAETSSG
jgi:GT2 family glycosyltransferase/glycosyltransferase involved in cell wall biosynthesis